MAKSTLSKTQLPGFKFSPCLFLGKRPCELEPCNASAFLLCKVVVRYRPPKVAGRLYRLILVMSKVQYLESTDLPLIDTVFIQPKLPLTPTDWCFVAAKGYATIYLNTKSPKSFGWSHHPLTKSLLVKGSLGPVYTGWVSSAGLALHLKVTKSRLSRSLLTQSNQSRAEEALCGGGSDGRLANFTGSHFVALAKSAAVCWNKSGAKI